MNKIIKSSAILSLCIFNVTFGFSDVQIQDWQYKAVEYLSEKKVLNGYEDGTFKPDQNVNRVEALKIILVSAEKDTSNVFENTFSDVENDAWFKPYVSFAATNNIVKGDAQTGLFSPGREVNKAEFIKMLLLAFDIDVTKYNLSEVEIADANEDDWFTPYFKFAVKFGVIKKDSSNNISPSKILNRGETAQIIFNILQSGRGLDPQVLLDIVENKLIISVGSLEKGDLFTASTNASIANDFSEILMEFLPGNNIVQAADKIAKALKSLIGAYIAGQNGLVDDIITASKQAWTWADESIKLNPNQEAIALEIKKFAESMANKARTEKDKKKEQ